MYEGVTGALGRAAGENQRATHQGERRYYTKRREEEKIREGN